MKKNVRTEWRVIPTLKQSKLYLVPMSQLRRVLWHFATLEVYLTIVEVFYILDVTL